MVTRPAHQAEPLCRLIEAAGGRPFRLPLLEIAPPEHPPAGLDRLEEYHMAIFISPNAVERGIALIRERGDLPPGLQLATVGRGSAARLEKLLGRKPDICAPPPFNSEALLTISPCLPRDRASHAVPGMGAGEDRDHRHHQRGGIAEPDPARRPGQSALAAEYPPAPDQPPTRSSSAGARIPIVVAGRQGGQ